jgi:hypothetical protein
MSEPNFLLKSPDIIQGIGPQRTQALKDAGIHTIADLFAARAPRIHSLLTGTSARQVGKWFCAATLLRVDGMTPDFAEVLVEAGIRSVGKLADTELQTLETAFNSGVTAGRISSSPSLYEMADLQREAWRARDRGMVAGLVQDDAQVPIAGAKIKLGSHSAATDDAGRYAFSDLPEGKINSLIVISGRPNPIGLAKLTVRAGKLTGPVKNRIPQAPTSTQAPKTFDEFDGELIVNTARTSTKLDTIALDAFRDGTYFLTREIRSNGNAALLSLYKRRIETTIYIYRAVVSPADLPANTAVGDVLLFSGGHLQKTTLTTSDVSRLKREKRQQAHPATQRRVIRIRSGA